MLKKIDRYIIRKYLGTFFFAMMLMTMVAIVIHLAEKIQKFLNPELTMVDILHYFLDYIPWINGLIFPLFSLIAVIFFTTRMAKDAEIISILSAGVPFRRIMRPYLIAAFIIAGLHYYGNHYLIPRSIVDKEIFENKYFKNKMSNNNSDLHLFLDPETKIFIKYFKKKDTTAQNFRLEKFSEDGDLSYVIKAKKIKKIDSLGVWRLSDYKTRTINGRFETLGLSKKGESMDTVLDFGLDDFVKYQKENEMMTSPDIKAHIKKLKQRGLGNTKAYETELHRRSSQPFSIIILTIIGLSVAGRKSRGGMGLNLAKGVAYGAVFVFMTQFAIAFSENLDMSPMLGMWFPNVLFGIVAIYLVFKAQK